MRVRLSILLALAAGTLAVLLSLFLGVTTAARAGRPWDRLVLVVSSLLAATPVAVGMLLLRSRVAVGGLAALATWGGVSLVVYAGLLWLFGFDQDEKRVLRSQFRRLVLDPARIDDWED